MVKNGEKELGGGTDWKALAADRDDWKVGRTEGMVIEAANIYPIKSKVVRAMRKGQVP